MDRLDRQMDQPDRWIGPMDKLDILNKWTDRRVRLMDGMNRLTDRWIDLRVEDILDTWTNRLDSQISWTDR